MVSRYGNQEEHRQPYRESADDRRRSVHVGFSWARQPAIRFQQTFGKGFTAAASLEQAEYIYSATGANGNFFIGNAGTGGGLYSCARQLLQQRRPGSHPQGHLTTRSTVTLKSVHSAAGSATATTPTRPSPLPSAAGGQNNTKMGGGGFVNIRVPATKYLDIGIHGLGGTGVGRYGTSTLPDVTVHPDGTLAPIKNYQGLVALEGHPTPKLDIFGYYGAEYAQRTVYLSNNQHPHQACRLRSNHSRQHGLRHRNPATSTGNGFAGGAPYNPGTPANCAGVTRVVIEATAGFTYRVYNSPKYGRLQYQGVLQLPYRDAWAGVGGAPKATNGMVFTGMRYYIPLTNTRSQKKRHPSGCRFVISQNSIPNSIGLH